MRGPQRRAREDTRGRLLALAWPACTPAPALQRSHFPDPPPATLRRHAGPFARLHPAAPFHAGPQPPSSALCLTAARTGAHWQAGNNHPLDTEGSHDRSSARHREIVTVPDPLATPNCGYVRNSIDPPTTLCGRRPARGMQALDTTSLKWPSEEHCAERSTSPAGARRARL